ncbi:uncharacterized protein LACBIDRAFT_330342 [Laccaria bicolor S238N-H82]|uniref:Predicted protein n=1 Tax=Laccaria bicolor (strain S238N-H82 / ATCC MYA-4686) TaxID=486041 RepID=B0DL01_LACBS|nr:uncharacterized protein LACBIDRAFT_330342 [Laccaria bicolor S238N-H82]EDR04737.1 predicted protein [Laccaria bicolor S238N-H82]|eukprot:XP_001884561.1 predicted protein [Laccaria bicolor S238N-H82]
MATPSQSNADLVDSTDKPKTTGRSTRAASKNLQLAEESAKGASTSAVPPAKGKATATSPIVEESAKGASTPAVPSAKGKLAVTSQTKPIKPGASSQKAPAPIPLPQSGVSAPQGSVVPIMINPPGPNLTMLQETGQILSDAPSLTYLTTISSISTLGHKSPRGSQRIFEGIPTYEDVLIYDEPLSISLARYHPRFNPAVDDDPLIFFGGIDGKLPGKSLEDSQGIRDLLWRWSAPHVQGLWVNLPTMIDSFPQVRLTPEYIHELTVDSSRDACGPETTTPTAITGHGDVADAHLQLSWTPFAGFRVLQREIAQRVFSETMTQHPWVAHVEFIEEAFRRQIHKTPRRRPTNNQQPARYQSFDVIPICHTVVFGVVQCAPAYLSIVFIDLLSTRSDMHEQLALHLISLRFSTSVWEMWNSFNTVEKLPHTKPGIVLAFASYQSARYHSMDPFMFGVVWQRLRMTNAFNATLDALDTFPGTSILYAGCQQVQCAPAYLSIVFIDLLSARSHMHEQLALHPPHLTLFAANCSHLCVGDVEFIDLGREIAHKKAGIGLGVSGCIVHVVCQPFDRLHRPSHIDLRKIGSDEKISSDPVKTNCILLSFYPKDTLAICALSSNIVQVGGADVKIVGKVGVLCKHGRRGALGGVAAKLAQTVTIEIKIPCSNDGRQPALLTLHSTPGSPIDAHSGKGRPAFYATWSSFGWSSRSTA